MGECMSNIIVEGLNSLSNGEYYEITQYLADKLLDGNQTSFINEPPTYLNKKEPVRGVRKLDTKEYRSVIDFDTSIIISTEKPFDQIDIPLFNLNDFENAHISATFIHSNENEKVSKKIINNR
jgi:hypothetical protein